MPRHWKVFFIVAIGVFMAVLDLFIVNIAFPAIVADFRSTTLSDLSWVLNAYAIVFAALLVPAGRWADLAGRKRSFIGGLAVFTLASGFCALAPSVPFLIAGRAIQAAGGALVLPSSLGLALPEFPPERRGTAVGGWAAIGGLAAAIGPPVGGLLTGITWKAVFLINLPIGVLTIALASRVLHEVRDQVAGRRPDGLGAMLLASGIGSLVLLIIKGPVWGWRSARSVAVIAAFLILLATTLLRSARHPSPVIELSLLRIRAFRLANFGSILFFTAFGGLILSGALFMTQVWEKPVPWAGLRLTAGPAMAALFAFPAGRVIDRFGQRATGVPGSILFATGCVWLSKTVGLQPDYVTEYLPGLLMTGSGVGLMIPTLASAAAISVPPLRLSTATGINGMARQIGSAVGIAIVIAILGPSSGLSLAAFQRGWLVMAGIVLVAGLVCFLLGKVRPPADITMNPLQG